MPAGESVVFADELLDAGEACGPVAFASACLVGMVWCHPVAMRGMAWVCCVCVKSSAVARLRSCAWNLPSVEAIEGVVMVDGHSGMGDMDEFGEYYWDLLNVEVSHWETLEPLGDHSDDRESWSATLHDLNGKEAVTIGSAWMNLFRFARFDGAFFDLADEVDGDLAHLAGAISRGGAPKGHLFRGAGEAAWHVVTINRLNIDPSMRGKGLGTAFVGRMLQLMLPAESAIVAVFPAPVMVAHEDRTLADWDRVRRFWTGAGFVHLADGVAVAIHDPEGADDEMHAWRRRVKRPWPTTK